MNGESPKTRPIDMHVHFFPAKELPDVVTFRRLGIPLDIAITLQKAIWRSDVFRDALDLLRRVLRAYDMATEALDDLTEGRDLTESLKDIISIALTGSGATESTMKRILHFLDLIDSDFTTFFRTYEKELLESGVPSAIVAQIDFSQLDYKAGNYESFHKYAGLHEHGPIKAFLGVNPFNSRSQMVLDFMISDPRMRSAFVGVKVYPSLGWLPTVNDLRNQRFFQRLEAHQIPVLTHASKGGIRTEEDTGDFANPLYWKHVLERYKIKVIFAHFGGNHNFVDHFLHGDRNWTAHIVDLMEQFPDQVYADLAFHESAVKSPSKYFQALHNALNNPTVSTQIVFGSDYPLHLPQYDYSTLINSYTDNLTSDQIKQLNDNARRVLELVI